MRKTLICFIIIFMSLPLMAQVKIKEKVEIKPEGKAEFVETGTTADPVKIYTVKGRTVFMEFVVEFTPCTYEFSSRKYIGDIQASLNLYVDGLYEPPLRVQSTSGRANIGIPVVANRSITTSPYFRLNMGTTLGHYPTTCFIENGSDEKGTKDVYVYVNGLLEEHYHSNSTDYGWGGYAHVYAVDCEPGPVVPIFDTYSIKAGEKSIVTPYFLIEQNANYKKLVKFHPDQEFDVSVFQLEGSAHIEDATGKVGTELTNVKMPIFVVPAENFVNLAEATEVLVTVKVAREKLIKTIENPEIIYEYTSEQISPSNLVNNTTETITLPDFTTDPKGCNTVVVEKPKNDCKEPIVECGDDWKQTEITDANFVVLGSNEDYTWVDEKGVTQTANTGNGCDYIKNNEEGMTEYGKVYLLSKMPMNGVLNSTGNYKMLDEASIDVCVDNNTGKWKTKLKNIKIPIFNSLCNIPPKIDGYNANDLKNGTSDDISNAIDYLINETNYFNSISNYNDKKCRALYYLFLTIKNIHKGSYFQKRNLSYYVPVFSSSSIEMHEDYHVRNIKTNILNLFQNEEFSNRLNTLSLPFNPTDCPEDIKQDSKSRLQDYLTGEFIKESNLQVKHGLINYSREPVLDNKGNVAIDENGEVITIPLYEFASELDADIEAMIITRTILKNIEEYRTDITNCKFK